MQRTHFTAGYTLYNCVCDKQSSPELNFVCVCEPRLNKKLENMSWQLAEMEYLKKIFIFYFNSNNPGNK